MRILILMPVFFLFLISAIYCQEKHDTITERGIVSLSLKNINFIKNNEFSNPIIEGYTLVGYFIQPAIIYSPSEKVDIQLGIHLLNYAGADKINQAKLVFSTIYKFSGSTSLTLGTLAGSDKHMMFDPHFDSERMYNSYTEDGLQFITKNDHFFSDTWISWEKFILPGDTTREQFTSGESFRFTSGKISDFLNLEIPVQLQFKHYGGQISNYNEHVETFFNLAAGIRINFDIAGKRLGVAGIEYLQFINKELQEEVPGVITSGYASWFRFHYKYKALYIGSYYWKGHNFYAPNGNPIYSSASTRTAGFFIPDRSIWTNSLYLAVNPVKYLELYLGFDFYYDPNLKRTDTAMALHMNLEKLIRIASIRQGASKNNR